MSLKIKTYKLGLLQAKSFRFLKNKGNNSLARHGIDTTSWAILGLICDKKEITKTELAKELLFKKPFITGIIQDLEKKKLVHQEVDKKDTRSTKLSLTKIGQEFVDKVEMEMSLGYGMFLAIFPPKDFEAYLNFIEKVGQISDWEDQKNPKMSSSDKEYLR